MESVLLVKTSQLQRKLKSNFFKMGESVCSFALLARHGKTRHGTTPPVSISLELDARWSPRRYSTLAHIPPWKVGLINTSTRWSPRHYSTLAHILVCPLVKSLELCLQVARLLSSKSHVCQQLYEEPYLGYYRQIICKRISRCYGGPIGGMQRCQQVCGATGTWRLITKGAAKTHPRQYVSQGNKKLKVAKSNRSSQ